VYNIDKVFYLTILDVYVDGMAMGLFFGCFGLWCIFVPAQLVCVLPLPDFVCTVYGEQCSFLWSGSRFG
jgi:hypothetical protein